MKYVLIFFVGVFSAALPGLILLIRSQRERWKQENCPTLAGYMAMTREEQKKFYYKICERGKDGKKRNKEN